MGFALKIANVAAREFLEKKHSKPIGFYDNKTTSGLCNLLGLKYPDGTKPRGHRDKKEALLSWHSTKRLVVVRSLKSEYISSKKTNSKRIDDLKIINSAISETSRFVKSKDRESYERATEDAFLRSPEWKRVRLLALDEHGRKCLCCGDTPENGAILNVDHIKPRKLYPKLALCLSNLQVLCASCNAGKGNKRETDYRLRFAQKFTR